MTSPIPTWVFVAVGVAAIATCVLSGALGGVDSLIAAGTIATAVGTLGLAWQTYALARATRRSVEESAAELEELKAQRTLLATQAEGVTAQAEATARLAESSAVGAIAAARTRIDAVAPLIHATVQETMIAAVDEQGHHGALGEGATWYEAQLKDIRFEITLKFILRNVGNAPAHLSFGGRSTELTNVSAKALAGVVIERDKEYVDELVVRISGVDAVNQTEVRVPFTYEGVIYAEMFDRIQWNGLITPLRLEDGVAKRSAKVVNQNGAQVFRSYLSLDEPDRIKQQSEAILGEA